MGVEIAISVEYFSEGDLIFKRFDSQGPENGEMVKNKNL